MTQHPADPLIDRSLDALRNAQPRAGAEALNRRILAGLQQYQAAAPVHQPRHSPLLGRSANLWRSPSFALATAIVLVAATGLFTTLHLRRERHISILKCGPSTTTPCTTTLTPTLLAMEPTSTPATKRVPHIPILRSRCGPTTTPRCATTTHLTPISLTTPIPTEQALLDDLHAPSQPAPPMPLTHDERMLLRAARRSDEVQLAHLEVLPRPAPHNRAMLAIADYVHRMLAPLVAAESLEPTPAIDTDTIAGPNPTPPNR